MKALLVAILILVLPVSAGAFEFVIGDVSLNKLGKQYDAIQTGNTFTFFVGYAEPIKIVQLITTGTGGGNFNVDILKYFKDGELYVWVANNKTLTYDRREDLKSSPILRKIFDDYLKKLSSFNTNKFKLVSVDIENNMAEGNHIDFDLLTEDKIIGHGHRPIPGGEVCKQTFRYDIPINVVQVFMGINRRTGQTLMGAWRYFKDGELFLFGLDADMMKKFGRVYYTRLPTTPEQLETIRAEFARYLNQV